MFIDGKVTHLERMKMEENYWTSFEEDPQCFICFKKPEKEIHLQYEIEDATFQNEKMTIYYSEIENSFTEEKCIRIPLLLHKKEMIQIQFERSIQYIRLDFMESKGSCNFKSFCLSGNKNLHQSNNKFKKLFNSFKTKVVVVTHELSKTGAPILAYNIALELKKKKVDVLVLALSFREGYLVEEYQKNRISLLCLDEGNENYKFFKVDQDGHLLNHSDQENMKSILNFLEENGYDTVIANTIVSGKYLKEFHEHGFKIISLIHEMRTTIEHYGFKSYGEIVSQYADFIVFPNEFVKKDFEKIYPSIHGEELIHPQGVYKKWIQMDQPSILEKYQLEGKEYIISSGTAELRKGIDLFVSAAIMLLNQNSDLHFVWTGSFNDSELEIWMKDQIERSGFVSNFHFISFIQEEQDYIQILRSAKVFWALSREDPFPSTVLEAMAYNVSVLGFKNTGGIQTMLSDGRGTLIDSFDLNNVVEQTKHLLSSNFDKNKKAKEYVDQLKFKDYVDFLLTCIKK